MASVSSSPIGFFARVDGKLLDEFSKRNELDFSSVSEETTREKARRFLDTLGLLDAEEQPKIWSKIFEIDDVATKQGCECLLETASDEGEILKQTQIDALTTNQSRSFFFYLYYPEIFESVLNDSRLDNVSGWSRFPLAKKSVQKILKNIPSFQSAIQEYYKKEYKGKNCKIVPSDREDRLFLTAFIEDSFRSDLAFENKDINLRTPKKPVLEAFFVYRFETGVLDIKARGGKEKLKALQEMFSEFLLETPQEFEGDVLAWDFKKFYDLGALTFPTEETDKVQYAQLRGLSLTHRGDYHKHSVQVGSSVPENGTGSLQKALGSIAKRLKEYTINQATLKIQFKPFEGTGRTKKVTVQISYPNRHNLKDRPQDLRVRELLKKWDIDQL